VVPVWDGAWVVRLAARRNVTLDEVRDELARELREAPVDTGELARVYAQLEADVELFLH